MKPFEKLTTDDLLVLCVSLTVFGSDMRLRCAKTTKQIEILFGVETQRYPRHIAVDGVLILLRRGYGAWEKCCPL